MKRALALCLALVMCLALLPVTVLAAEDDFVIEDGVLIKYNGPGGDVVIPEGVTEIGEWAFEECNSLTSVTIPEGVSSIGEMAFADCRSLMSVTIPASVTTIGMGAFTHCTSLTSVTVPAGVTTLGWGVFYACESLTSVVISEGVTSIGEMAFYWCRSLTSVTIPASVTYIGNSAFGECSDLTSVIISDGVPSIGETAFFDCPSLMNVTIPESVTYIGNSAFFGCDALTDVYYGGNEGQWGQIEIDNMYGRNDSLLSATVHFNRKAFADVPADEYYADAVVWALGKGITTGTDPGLFSPEEACTRAQIVTFLWRAFGKPEPVSAVSQFGDVTDPSEYYYKAVLWAVENGITTGTDPGVFAPEEECTREQIVTFLWRAFGKPEPVSTVSQFGDVTDPREYYYNAVLWAVEQGITTGTDPGVFSPEEECTRAQIVTFLYRALA